MTNEVRVSLVPACEAPPHPLAAAVAAAVTSLGKWAAV